MNNKGFTLIELLATIVLLAVIASISFVSITAAINKGKKSSCENIQKSIKNATIKYVSDHRYKSNYVKNNDVITGDFLTSDHYLTTPIKNPFTKEDITPSDIKIKVTLNDQNTVTDVEITKPDVLKNCNG